MTAGPVPAVNSPGYVWGRQPTPCPAVPSTAEAQAIGQAVAGALARYDPLFRALWTAYGPSVAQDAQTYSLIAVDQPQNAQELLGFDPLRRGWLLVNRGPSAILLGRVATVGKTGSSDKGTLIAAGGTASAALGEWTTPVYAGTIAGAADSLVDIRPLVVPQVPWGP